MRTWLPILVLVLAGCTPDFVAGPLVVDGRGRYELQESVAISRGPCVGERGRPGDGTLMLSDLAVVFGRGAYDVSYRLDELCAFTAFDFTVISTDSIRGGRSGSWQLLPPDSVRFFEAFALHGLRIDAARFIGNPPTHVRLHGSVDLELAAVR